MMTSLGLMSIYKTTHVPLRDVCQCFFGLGYEEAAKRAARNALPVPAFRLIDSQKAPLMVSCEDLGNYIDLRREAAHKAWAHCQV
jgi:hypothetical protein